ncbi:hypothetical protein K469DRAFT_563364, partial [Zopfia rhizophila CBS 207.26]
KRWASGLDAQNGVRDQIILGTKFTSFYTCQPDKLGIRANYQGNPAKGLRLNGEASLKKLKVDYIDLLYVHRCDFTASIEDTMQSLNNLVVAGNVLCLGLSDAPAWIVPKANKYARDTVHTRLHVAISLVASYKCC